MKDKELNESQETRERQKERERQRGPVSVRPVATSMNRLFLLINVSTRGGGGGGDLDRSRPLRDTREDLCRWHAPFAISPSLVLTWLSADTLSAPGPPRRTLPRLRQTKRVCGVGGGCRWLRLVMILVLTMRIQSSLIESDLHWVQHREPRSGDDQEQTCVGESSDWSSRKLLRAGEHVQHGWWEGAPGPAAATGEWDIHQTNLSGFQV